MAEYRKNHLVPVSYLDRWAGEDGLLQRVPLPGFVSEARRPETVGYRKDFWGTDPDTRRFAERVTAWGESKALPILRDLERRWPLEPEGVEWLFLSQFLSLQILRSVPGQELMSRSYEEYWGKWMSEVAAEWSDERVQAFLAVTATKEQDVHRMMSAMPHFAVLIASMHWTLLEFPERLLATSDQPVTIVPVGKSGERWSRVQAIPDGPLIEAEEIRFPVSPTHALLLTWLDRPCEGPALAVGDGIAAELNRAVIAQADREWFHHPARRPTRLKGSIALDEPCGIVGRMVYPGYGREAALASPRHEIGFQKMFKFAEEETLEELGDSA